MAAPRDRKHLILSIAPLREGYTPHNTRGGGGKPPSPSDRAAHGQTLRSSLKQAQVAAMIRRKEAGGTIEGAEAGIYLEFEGVQALNEKEKLDSFDLALDELGGRGLGLALASATMDATGKQHAIVFVPDESVAEIEKRFDAYVSEKTPDGNPKHQNLVERTGLLKLATVHALWTDKPQLMPPQDEERWLEVWLRDKGEDTVEGLKEFAARIGAQVRPGVLSFGDRVVTLMHTNLGRLAAALDVLDTVAEIRPASEVSQAFTRMTAREQVEWMRDLQARTQSAPSKSPHICVLDTGVNRGHPLLQSSLDEINTHTYDPDWKSGDHDGHGTEMAGLALYGNLSSILSSQHPVILGHRLESVKIQSPPSQPPTPPELWGHTCTHAASLVEMANKDVRRVFSMAIASAETKNSGQPTSWSASLDALAAGRQVSLSPEGITYLDARGSLTRLFIVCAGNVRHGNTITRDNYLDRCDLEPILDPGQSWNALTVGAITHLDTLPPEYPADSWQPVAPLGELSPHSTTSVAFDGPWPIKPDVVFEGGNLAADKDGQPGHNIATLCLLTTRHSYGMGPFSLTACTSAATALASRFAAQIMTEYPSFRDETVRGLIVHAARWTPAMLARFKQAKKSKKKRLPLVRRYGFGLPDIERALRSATNSLTMIVEQQVTPFRKGKMGDIHLFELPWPSKELEDLGPMEVELRVTLSYFVEPNPARRGWKGRYRYASHGLAFDLKRPKESNDSFRKRLNQQALDGDEKSPPAETDSRWFLGSSQRNKGSLHCDIWSGSAADLAARGLLAVYPTGGWWKDVPNDTEPPVARYSLLVSIDSPSVDIDIYTPVENKIKIPIET